MVSEILFIGSATESPQNAVLKSILTKFDIHINVPLGKKLALL